MSTAGREQLEAHLHLPAPGAGVVVFAHGSGSSRRSPRNQYVASVLQQAGLGTLLLDLLTPGEETDRGNVFDIGLLAERLLLATAWLREQPGSAASPVGYFGASTGAGAALWAAAELEETWQVELWGSDALAEERRQRRADDFRHAAQFARAAAHP